MRGGLKFRIRHKIFALIFAAGLASPVAADDPPEWFAPVKPFHIIGNIYYVGTKGLAAYLILGKDGAILLDGTSARNAKQIEHNIESIGVPLRQVKLIISSHAHEDHVGALAEIKHATGARFLASSGDRAALERGTPRGDTEYATRHFPPIQVDGIVEDGQTIRRGGIALTAHMTPGHTPGCTSWSTTVREAGAVRRVLFLCSITVAGNRLVGNRAYPRIASDFRATFAKLEGMQADIVLPGHPELVGVFEKKARREAGEADAFVDPAALARIVAASRAEFQGAFDRERAGVPDGGREPARRAAAREEPGGAGRRRAGVRPERAGAEQAETVQTTE